MGTEFDNSEIASPAPPEGPRAQISNVRDWFLQDHSYCGFWSLILQ